MNFEAAILALKATASAGAALGSAWLIGRAALGRADGVRRTLTAVELNLFASALGAAALSQTIFLLGLVGLIYDATFIVLAVAAAALWLKWGRGKDAGRTPEQDSRAGALLFAIPALFFGPLYVANALAPETGFDAVTYHLGLVFHYYREHTIPGITTSVYAFLSQGVEMLYLFGFAFARHAAPKLIHFGLFLATLVAMAALGRRMRRPLAGWAAAALYGCTSAVATDAVTAYNDCALAFFSLMLFYAFVVWLEEGGRGWPSVIGVLAGFCVAVKLTGAIAAAAAGALLLWRVAQLRQGWAPAVRFGLIAALFALSWPARNVVVAGNPAAPFYNRVFPNPYVSVRWEDDFRGYFHLYRWPHERRGWIDYAELPLEATVRGIRHGGLIGPFFLAAPVLILLGWRRRWSAALLAAAAITTWPYLSNSGTRFLIPGLPFVCLAAALAAERFRGRGKIAVAAVLVAAHAATMWPAWVPLWREGKPFWRLPDAPWPVVVGQEDPEEYKSRLIPGYALMRALTVNVPAGSRVLALHSVPEAYFPGEVVVSHDGLIGDELAREMMMVLEPDFQPTRVTRLNWSAREITGTRLRQTATQAESWWAISELKLIQDGIPRTAPAAAKVVSDVGGWATAKLIDSDPLTVWRPWRPLGPASVSLLWAQPSRVDGLSIQAPWGQHFPKYEIEARGADGRWTSVEYSSEIERLDADIGALKARAHQALREQGMRAVIGRLGGGGQSMILEHVEKDPASWGLEEAWRGGDARIYRVLETRMR